MQTEMGEEEWDTGPIPRAGVWGGRQRGAGQQGGTWGLKEAEETVPLPCSPPGPPTVSLLLGNKGPRTIRGSQVLGLPLRCTGSANLRCTVPLCSCPQTPLPWPE